MRVLLSLILGALAHAAALASEAPPPAATLEVGERRAILVTAVDRAFVVPAGAADLARLGRQTLVLTARRPGAAELRVQFEGREWSMALTVTRTAVPPAPLAHDTTVPREPDGGGRAGATEASVGPGRSPGSMPIRSPASGERSAADLAEGDFLPRPASAAEEDPVVGRVIPIPPLHAAAAGPLISFRPAAGPGGSW